MGSGEISEGVAKLSMKLVYQLIRMYGTEAKVRIFNYMY